MVISTKQHEANCRNAQNSTGPKTPEGKAKASMNAIKHGLRARRTPIFNESKEEFEQLCDDLQAEWQPQDLAESAFVEQLACQQWMLARVTRHEFMTYTFFLDKGFLELNRHLKTMEFYSIQKSRLERAFAKTIRDLQHLQKTRPAQLTEPRPSGSGRTPDPPDPPITEPRPSGSGPEPAYKMSPG
jgi:hypothetical protein